MNPHDPSFRNVLIIVIGMVIVSIFPAKVFPGECAGGYGLEASEDYDDLSLRNYRLHCMKPYDVARAGPSFGWGDPKNQRRFRKYRVESVGRTSLAYACRKIMDKATPDDIYIIEDCIEILAAYGINKIGKWDIASIF